MPDKAKERIVLTVTIPLDAPTPRGIVYPKKEMEKAVEKYLEKHRGKAMLGALNPDFELSSCIMNLLNISHQITKLEVKESDLLCQVLLLDTPMGKVVKNLYNETNTLNFAPKIIGHFEEEPQEDGTVKREMKIDELLSVDIV